MNKTLGSLFALPLALAAAALVQAQSSKPAYTGNYSVSQTLHVGGDGAWDYLTVDSKKKLLFLSRDAHMMVVDATTGATVADITGLQKSHGILLAPGSGRGFVTDGGDGSVAVFDLKTYTVLGKVKTEVDSDGIIYDPASKKIFVASGDEDSVLSFSPDIDLMTGKADPPIPLGGKPDYLAADGKGRIYINLADENQVAVIDTKTRKVVDRWSTAPGGHPVSMAIDREHRRLFIGCRSQKLIVMSADNGKVLADLPIGADADTTHLDGDVFDSCRDGTLTITRETSPGHFENIQTIKTGPWAGTMGLDRETHTLYIPMAEFTPPLDLKKRTAAIPGSFTVMVVKRSGG